MRILPALLQILLTAMVIRGLIALEAFVLVPIILITILVPVKLSVRVSAVKWAAQLAATCRARLPAAIRLVQLSAAL